MGCDERAPGIADNIPVLDLGVDLCGCVPIYDTALFRTYIVL